MKADSKYIFKRNGGLLTSYILQSHEGADLPNFPATYKRVPRNRYGVYPDLKNKKFVNFREMCNTLNPLQRMKWEYCLSLASAKCPVGFNFPNGTRRASSDNRSYPNRNDCFLVEFSEDWNELTLYVFFHRGNDCEELLRAWNSGQSIEVKE